MDVKRKYNDINIESFLLLGYWLDYKNNNINFDFEKINKKKYSEFSRDELVSIGKRKLLDSFDKLFENNKTHLVPISGGLDSRALLACLMEFTDTKNIYTYTFGTSNTYDFEIGNEVASYLGTNHLQIDLEKYTYSTDGLIEFSNQSDNQTLLFHHPPISMLKKYFSSHCIWSGFMGDPVAGSHLQATEFNNELEVKEKFIKNNTFVKSVNLYQKENSSLYKYINGDINNNYDLTLYEQIDFQNRQLKYIAPHVLPHGFKYRLPFIQNEWYEFMLSLDDKYRRNQFLYIDILLSLSPTLFGEIRTKHSYGLKLTTPDYLVFLKKHIDRVRNFGSKVLNNVNNPYVNYINFERGIRERKDLNRVIKENINDLIKRDITPIDISNIYSRHMEGKKNYSDALLTLASLEIHFKALES